MAVVRQTLMGGPGRSSSVTRIYFVSALFAAWLFNGSATAQEPRTTSQETFVASVRIENIDKSTRWLTVRSDAGTTFTVAVVPEVKIFDELKVGDTISVRYVESLVVAVRPGTKLQAATDTTAAAQRGAPSGRGEVVQQSRMVVTIERVDVPKRLVVYRTADNQSLTRRVADTKLLDGLKAGDVVEVTFTRERAIEIKKGR
jgi:Cu/Ag efflux protein CusF